MSETTYLGETIMDIKDTPFKDYTPADWALYAIETWGQYDGGHHKQWSMDQAVRALKGCTIEIKLAKWSTGDENWRINFGTSDEYEKWVVEMKTGEDGAETYEYDEGIAP